MKKVKKKRLSKKRRILSLKNGSLLLGPGFIDHVISRAMPQLSRPDVIRLDATPNTSLTLTQLFEIKSGKNITPLRKIRGFSKLLREWRKKPDFLQTLLQSSLIDFDFEVNQIIIPPDDDITVTFVTPNLRRAILFDRAFPRFRVQHMQIPLKESV